MARTTVVPWLSWKDVKTRSLAWKLLLSVAWFTDKIGWVLEQTPLRIFFCSFWLDRYLPKAKIVIEDFRNARLSQEECERKLGVIDRKIYLYWLAIVVIPVIAIWQFAILLMSGGFFESKLLSYLSGIGVLLIMHELACPSSLRHHEASLQRGDIETAGMNEQASPSTKRYFRREVLKLC